MSHSPERRSDRLPAVGLDVGRVIRVADQRACCVPVGRQEADEPTSDLSVAAGDQYVHA